MADCGATRSTWARPPPKPRRVAATVPKKNQQVEALGFSLPLRGWPATDYRLRVTVKDQVAGASAPGSEKLRAAALESDEARQLDGAVAAARGQVDAALAALEAALPGQATGTRQSLQKSRKNVAATLDKLAEAAARDREQLAGHRLAAWKKVAAALMPGGAPQERVCNLLVPYAMRWGEDLPARLLAAMAADADAPMHLLRPAEL